MEGVAVLVASSIARSKIFELPGRTFRLLHSPDETGARNMSLGIATFPAGSAPEGHVHIAEEEIVYVAAGRGRLIADDSVVELVPGTAVYIPPGVMHATVAYDEAPLQLVCAFSPPVTPGSYEPRTVGPRSESMTSPADQTRHSD